MKRLGTLVCTTALLASIAVPQAFGGGVLPAHIPAGKVPGAVTIGGGFVARPAGVRSFAGFSAASPSRAFTFGGGSTIESATELPYPSQVPSGSVSAVSHPDEVYWFYVAAGGEMTFHLSPTDPNAHIELRLYPLAEGVTLGSTPLAEDFSYVYPTSDSVAPSSGMYLAIDVHATSGSSDYTLNYDWTGADDDFIPGSAIARTPMTGWLDYDWDWENISRLTLRKGDKLTVKLSTPAGVTNDPAFDASVWLFPPGSPSGDPAFTAASDVIHSNVAGLTDGFTYKSPSTGAYYIDVYDDNLFGAYSLAWSVNPLRPAVARTPNADKLSYKRVKGVAKFTLGARFTDQFGLSINNVKVYLQTSSNGKTWKSSYSMTTSTNGAASKSFKATKKGVTYYRWYRAKTSTSTAATSRSTKVTVK